MNITQAAKPQNPFASYSVYKSHHQFPLSVKYNIVSISITGLHIYVVIGMHSITYVARELFYVTYDNNEMLEFIKTIRVCLTLYRT